jgi:hypothetical protein
MGGVKELLRTYSGILKRDPNVEKSIIALIYPIVLSISNETIPMFVKFVASSNYYMYIY